MQWLVVVCVALGAAAARGQEPIRVRATVSPDRILVGDAGLIQVVVEGADRAQRPATPVIDGCSVSFLEESDASTRALTIINGRTIDQSSRRYVFRYSVSPNRAGDFSLPAVSVTVDGVDHRSGPVAFSAEEPPANPDFRLVVSPESAAVYAGEPVPVRVTWYLGGRIDSAGFRGQVPEGVAIHAAPDPRITDAAADPRDFAEFEFLGVPTVARWGTGRLDGRVFQTLTFEVIAVADRGGELSLGPVYCAFGIEGPPRRDPGLRRDPLDLSIFTGGTTTRAAIRSNTVAVTVRDLPSEGRPADFTGLVGPVAVRAEASATAARTGDPIGLTLRVEAPEPALHLRPPDLSRSPEHAASFRVATEGWTALRPTPPGRRDYSTTIRPTRAGAIEVPPISIPYFDPRTGRYERAATDPIPVDVTAARVVTAADAIRSPGADAAGPGPSGPPVPGPGGMRANDESPAVLASQRVDWAAGWRVPAAVAAAPAVAYLALVATIAAASRDRGRPALVARRWARRASAAPGDVSIAAAGVRAVLGAIARRDPDTLTADECASITESACPALANDVRAAVAAAESARYRRDGTPAGTAAPAAPLLRRLARDGGRR